MGKVYVVFRGRKQGVFKTWEECEEMVGGFKGSKFKGYGDEKEGYRALKDWNRVINGGKPRVGIVSDASYMRSSGLLEYRFIDLESGEEKGTKKFKKYEVEHLTNFGEFCGLVRAIKYVVDNELKVPVYSDSQVALKYLESISRKKMPRVLKWETDIWGENPADFGRK